jgi:hypothetical protein
MRGEQRPSGILDLALHLSAVLLLANLDYHLAHRALRLTARMVLPVLELKRARNPHHRSTKMQTVSGTCRMSASTSGA